MSIIRAGLIGDHHIRPERRADRYRSIKSMAETGRDLGVNLWLQAGDWFDRTSTPEDRLESYESLFELTEVAELAMVDGNHDKDKDITPLSLLRTKHSIFATERFELIERQGILIATGPHVEKGNAVAAMPLEASSESQDKSIAALTRGVFAYYRMQIDRFPGPTILLSHCLVAGSTLSGGESAPDRGVSFSVADLLSTGADYVALGHIHLSQEWDGGRVRYAGSTTRNDFGDEDDAKSWTLIEFNGKEWRREIIPLPTRPMRTFRASFEPAKGWTDDFDRVTPDTEVRVKVSVPSDCNAELARMEQRILDLYPGVKIESKIVTAQRVRAPEIISAKAPEERFEAWLKSSGQELDGKARAEVLEKLGQAKVAVSA